MKQIKCVTAALLALTILLPSVLLWGNLSFLKTSAYSVITAVNPAQLLKGSLTKATKEIEQATSDYIGFHDSFINLFGLGTRLIGSRLVNTGDRTVVKLDSGTLCEVVTDRKKIKAQAEQAKENATSLAVLKEKLDQQNIPLLFVLAPCNLDKNQPGLPYRMNDYKNETADSFLKELEKFGVDYLDLREVWQKQGWSITDGFFRSDLHWRPQYALLSWAYVAQYLNDCYGIQNDPALFDLTNQRVETYPNVSLGSTGRVIGKYYAQTDTAEVYLPNYETKFHVINKRLGWDKTGSYEETTIDRSVLDRGGLFANDLINIYCAEDSVVENEKAQNEANVVFIRDSFGGMLGGYVPLTFQRTNHVNMRSMNERAETVASIIERFDTDMVIVFFYVDSISRNGMFHFE